MSDPDAQRWFVLEHDAKPSGPHALSALRDAWRLGKLAGSTLIARPGDRAWQRVDQLMSPGRGRTTNVEPDGNHTSGRNASRTKWILICSGVAVLFFSAGGVVGSLLAFGAKQPEMRKLMPLDELGANNVGARGSGASLYKTPSPLHDQVVLIRNSMDKIFRIRLGDYTWTDYGFKQFWGREIGGIDTVTPIGPDAIAMVDQYLNAIGARRVHTVEQANEGIASDIEAMSKPSP